MHAHASTSTHACTHTHAHMHTLTRTYSRTYTHACTHLSQRDFLARALARRGQQHVRFVRVVHHHNRALHARRVDGLLTAAAVRHTPSCTLLWGTSTGTGSHKHLCLARCSRLRRQAAGSGTVSTGSVARCAASTSLGAACTESVVLCAASNGIAKCSEGSAGSVNGAGEAQDQWPWVCAASAGSVAVGVRRKRRISGGGCAQ